MKSEKSNKKFSRREFLQLSAVSASVLLTSCVVAPVTPAAPAPEEAGEAAEPAQVPEGGMAGEAINVVMIAEPREEALQKLTPEFEKSTGIKVNIQLLGWEPLKTKLLAASQGATGEFDVIHLDYFEIPQYVQNGWIADLSPWVERDKAAVDPDDFHPGVKKTHIVYDGNWYGMPMHVNGGAFFYRTDIFEEMGLEFPTDWDDVVVKAKAINDRYASEGINGISLMAAPDAQGGCTFLHVLAGVGGYFFDRDTYKATINTPEGVKAIQIMQELVNYAPSGVAGYSLDQNYVAFAQGKAAMTSAWTTGYYYFADPEKSQILDLFDNRSMPGGKTIAGGWSLAVASASKHQEAAWEWIKWATSKEMEVRLLGNMETPRISLLGDPEIQEAYPSNAAYLDLLEGDPIEFPAVPGATAQMLPEAGKTVNSALIGASTAEEAAQELDDKFNEILQRAGVQA